MPTRARRSPGVMPFEKVLRMGAAGGDVGMNPDEPRQNCLTASLLLDTLSRPAGAIGVG